MSLIYQKICSKCSLPKDFSSYYKNSRAKDGLRKECKKCSREFKRSTKEIHFKTLLNTARNRAKRESYSFELDLEWMILNCPNVCPVYNTPLVFNSDNDYQKPSIDRLDCNKGYEKDNCRIISWAANRLRGNATLEELEKLVEYLRANQ